VTEHPTIPESVNVLVRLLLRSPLHRLMSHNTMVLGVTGRQTGMIYRVPVSYSVEGTELVCFTDAPWWKNLRKRAPVTATINGRRKSGTALAATGPIVIEHLTRHLRVVPRDAKYHAVRMGPRNEPHLGDLERAALSTAMIRVRLSER
jgi:hypothetical protein